MIYPTSLRLQYPQSWTLKVFRLITAEFAARAQTLVIAGSQPKHGVSGPARAAAKPPALGGWAQGAWQAPCALHPNQKASACCGAVQFATGAHPVASAWGSTQLPAGSHLQRRWLVYFCSQLAPRATRDFFLK
jgi:hypothetical protein